MVFDVMEQVRTTDLQHVVEEVDLIEQLLLLPLGGYLLVMSVRSIAESFSCRDDLIEGFRFERISERLYHWYHHLAHWKESNQLILTPYWLSLGHYNLRNQVHKLNVIAR